MASCLTQLASVQRRFVATPGVTRGGGSGRAVPVTVVSRRHAWHSRLDVGTPWAVQSRLSQARVAMGPGRPCPTALSCPRTGTVEVSHRMHSVFNVDLPYAEQDRFGQLRWLDPPRREATDPPRTRPGADGPVVSRPSAP